VRGIQQQGLESGVQKRAATLHACCPAGEAAAAGPTKVCRRCAVERPTTEFHRQLSRPDGLYRCFILLPA
jgi:hypothetical protein